MPDLYELIRNFGFPGAVALFVLWRLDSRLAKLTDKVSQLHTSILVLLDRTTRPSGGDT